MHPEDVDATQEAAKAATIKNRKDTVLNLHNMGMDEDFIAQAVNVSIDLVKRWLGKKAEAPK